MSELEPPTVDVRTPALPASRQRDHLHPAINAALLDSLAADVLATRGVLRLEPTLQGSLRRLMTATKQRPPGLGRPAATVAGSDRITVTHRPGPSGRAETQVSVDIATSTLAPARQIARTVRETIVDCLQLNGHQPGVIRVNVLSIEPGPTQPATIPQPGAEDDWEPTLLSDAGAGGMADEAVRDHLGELLTAGTNLFGGSQLMDRLDPLSIFAPLLRTGFAAVSRPDKVASVLTRAAGEMLRATAAATVRATGGTPAYAPKRGKDRRFADPAWTGNAGYWWLREIYDDWEQSLLEIVRDTDTPPAVKQKAEFAVQLMIDALAPTNFALANPAVTKKALDTGGLSLAKGARNFAHDLLTNQGAPRQVVPGAHTVGKDMAVTPGKVVFQNELMELIQYAPSTAEVHEIPLLFTPPWINKYYVMDLAPGRSLVQWVVDHGHTVFMISYRNPDERMRHVQMDDYLISGPIAALEVIGNITGAEKANLLGLCLGGTLTMATLAYLDAVGMELINSATFLNTLIDFSEPGLLGVFTDGATISRLEKSMKRTGFLPKEDMQRSFNLLRTNDLIWNYVVSSWLMGEEPPTFDLLSWNDDSTRMPAEMRTFYLRSCYVENELARGVMELAGQRLDLAKVDQDLYFLSAEQDHIAPWRSSYAGARLPSGDVRFVLSNSGHIAGIVNPPSPKSIHRVLEDHQPLPPDPADWLAAATIHSMTWWEDWAQWIAARAGGMQKPPRMGSRKYRPITDAPGRYVLER